ncbi:DUF4382 domain-containing protein [Maribacter algicola]|uniref:DUF4382 domain-containing protein n=1 Tax=Meishania litoralis TaxID=3434685 RepID=A0ACC7LJC3_9FLAO
MKIKTLKLALFLFSLILMACSDNDDNQAYGRLSVHLTDAPFPYDLVAEANVTIFKIDARLKGGNEENTENEESTEIEESTEEDIINEDNGSFVVLMEGEITVNLLDLTNGVTQQLVDTEVPVGSYDLIRVHVEGVNVVLTSGQTYDLKVPSGSQSGIKIFLKPDLTITGGLSSDLLLDFDVSKSFVPKGGTDIESITGFNFKPVIKASHLSTVGTLTGTVSELVEEVATGIEGAQVAIYDGDAQITSTFTDESGAYMVMGLEAGTYTLIIEKEGYLTQTIEEINITPANKTTLDVELELSE